jgi:3',5'-cyclic AMP phosphodiesterase CpdA
VSLVSIVQLSDLHFGRDVDLEQIRALQTLIPTLAPTAIVVAGDLTQRARFGELQAAVAFADHLRAVAPTLVIPGNHDVQWWASPLGVAGTRLKYRKYRSLFGESLTPGLELPGLVLASTLTSHGWALGSTTWKFWRDSTVKGHLPAAEVDRAAAELERSPADALRVMVMHHNLLRGKISRRMGLAHWRRAQARVVGSGADVVLCGHDHQEGAELLADRVVVSTSSTHTTRTRGHRPSAFNVVTADRDTIAVTHYPWDRAGSRFVPGAPGRFPRRGRS